MFLKNVHTWHGIVVVKVSVFLFPHANLDCCGIEQEQNTAQTESGKPVSCRGLVISRTICGDAMSY